MYTSFYGAAVTEDQSLSFSLLQWILDCSQDSHSQTLKISSEEASTEIKMKSCTQAAHAMLLSPKLSFPDILFQRVSLKLLSQGFFSRGFCCKEVLLGSYFSQTCSFLLFYPDYQFYDSPQSCPCRSVCTVRRSQFQGSLAHALFCL